MRYRGWMLAAFAAAAVGLTACGSTSSGGSASGSSTTPASSPSSSSTSGTTSSSSGAVLSTKKTSLGTVLTNSKGLTLYWFAIDTPTTSKCSGSCLTFWPPVTGTPTAASGVTLSGKLGTITRSDGSLQATYNGHPLYTFSGDKAPGQTSGNKVNGSGGLWYAVTVSGSSSSGAGAGATPKPTSTGGSGGYGY
jgi:predicted lipoprotein with Yx(FWY)xxD motif